MTNFDKSFANLLVVWNRHQELRSSNAPLSDLASSHFDLDVARRMFR